MKRRALKRRYGRASSGPVDTTAANDTPAYRPLLDVTVVPEPSSSMLVMVGLAAITGFLKKRHARC